MFSYALDVLGSNDQISLKWSALLLSGLTIDQFTSGDLQHECASDKFAENM